MNGTNPYDLSSPYMLALRQDGIVRAGLALAAARAGTPSIKTMEAALLQILGDGPICRGTAEVDSVLRLFAFCHALLDAALGAPNEISV